LGEREAEKGRLENSLDTQLCLQYELCTVKQKTKKDKTPKQRLTEILAKHFAKLPGKEARQKISRLAKRLTADRANDRAKREQQAHTHLSRALNRPH